ncbi:peroxidase family protein [Acrocarpospora sp. B8E8]|uniref:peroxidase family protein n=1 Tax=Acrocarpospora sp. B8E8 TaxID=3153572 RepID=UPI00325C9B45
MKPSARIGWRNYLEFWVLTSGEPVWQLIRGIPPLHAAINRFLVDRLVMKLPLRPNPLSTMGRYTSWESLTNRTFDSRHLPPVPPSTSAPDPVDVAQLFRRDGEATPCPRSTVLFAYFAQWFTDGFLRGDMHVPRDPRKNSSNHEIDLNQLYGLTPTVTATLRTGSGGLLKSQLLNGGEFPPYLCELGRIKDEFAPLNVIRFDDIPFGARDALFACGSDRANLHIGFTMLTTLFLREHNRVARLLAEHHPDWDDERLFQTTRNILVVLLIKIVLEEYINHITPTLFQVVLDPAVSRTAVWHRTNHMAIEFNLLYRWHSLIPSALLAGGRERPLADTLAGNRLLPECGLGPLFEDASTQRAGRIGLFNTDPALLHVEELSVAEGRVVELASFNDYRAYCGFPRLKSFAEVSSDPRVQRGLAELYASVDDIDFYTGIFAEDPLPGSLLSPVMQRIITVDAFSQAYTNPLLSPQVYGPDTFSPTGMEIIETTARLSDVLNRNLPEVTRPFKARMTHK